MLIALVTLIIILMGTGGDGNNYIPKDFSKRVKSEVSDKEVRKQVDAVVKQVNEDVEAYRKEAEALARKGMGLNADYDAEMESFEGLIDQVVDLREGLQDNLIDNRFKLLDILTEEQWNAVFVDEK
jgi:uncharacterized protein YoxC